MSSETYHEAAEDLTDTTRDLHRAIRSLMEEFEAVDWYQQRVDATKDPELAAILAHNRDEELEHAMMVLEWLRRKNPTLAEHAKTYLFTKGPITEIEEGTAGGGEGGESSAPPTCEGSLGIGSLKPTKGAK